MSGLQQQIAEILDVYKLPNIAALRKKVTALRVNNKDDREAQLLEFVVAAYEHDCDSQV